MNAQFLLKLGMTIMLIFSFGTVSFAAMPGADPAELWDYITRVSPYKDWGFWPDLQGMQRGRAPHGVKHKVFVNKAALTSKRPPVKYGAIQVKENFNRNGKLMAITVMYKVKGYNPGDGDWFWVKYNRKGRARPYGKPNGCIECHGTRARNDFILVHDFW